MYCRHCRHSRVSRPRGLCWICYYTPGLRERYPPISKFGRRGPGNFHSSAPLPPRPTAALPGTGAKVAVLEERARQHLQLWHPCDASVGL